MPSLGFYFWADHNDQDQLERKGFILSHSSMHGKKRSQGRSSSQDLEAGAEAGAMGSAASCLAPKGLLSMHSYGTHDHLPRGVIIHSCLKPPTLVVHQVNAPTGQSNLRILLMSFPLPIWPKLALN